MAAAPGFIADRVRFELTVRFHVHTLSRQGSAPENVAFSAQKGRVQHHNLRAEFRALNRRGCAQKRTRTVHSAHMLAGAHPRAELCPFCGSDVSVCGEVLCRQPQPHRHSVVFP